MWKIPIAVEHDTGRALIGAIQVRDSTRNVDTERVFGCQLRYRVIAQDQAGAYRLCTATQAHKYGWKIANSNPFPRR